MNFVHQHELVEGVCMVGYGLGFVIFIIRFDIANGKQGRKTYVLLGCESVGGR